MKKQFLDNLSSEFPNALNCSSIRMNAEQQQAVPIRRTGKSAVPQAAAPKNKKFEQHSIVGFEMSLSMSGNRQNILQLMRSKSANNLAQPKISKLQVNQKKQEQVSFNGGSLYNTTSFDEVTMNITANTKHNNTHLNTKLQDAEDEKGFSRTFKKPHGFTAFKESYDEDKLTICINKDTSRNNIKIEGDLKKSNADLLGGLKCSGVDKQLEVSYEQPYFKAVIVNPEKLDRKKTADFPNRFMNDNRRQNKKMTSVQGMTSAEKKLTLRDYMYLSKLSGKPKDRQSIIEGSNSPKFSRQTLGVSRNKRKINLNNTQVMDRLKQQVGKQIRLVQGNLSLLLQYIDSCEYQNQVSHEQLMKMYSIARILKDKIVVGNDQLVLNLQNMNNQ